MKQSKSLVAEVAQKYLEKTASKGYHIGVDRGSRSDESSICTAHFEGSRVKVDSATKISAENEDFYRTIAENNGYYFDAYAEDQGFYHEDNPDEKIDVYPATWKQLLYEVGIDPEDPDQQD